MSDNLYFGFITKPVNNWQSYMKPITAPKNYGETASKKYIEDTTKRNAIKAARTPCMATIIEAAIITSTGNQIFFKSSCKPGEVSCLLMSCNFLTTHPTAIGDVVGLDVVNMLYIAHLEAIKYGKKGDKCLECDDYFPIDPYNEMIIEEHRNTVDVFALCKYLEIPFSTNDAFSSIKLANIARELCLHSKEHNCYELE